MARTAKRYQNACGKEKANETTRFFVGIYSRVSVVHNDDKSETIENQIDIVTQFVQRLNATADKEEFIIQGIYIDRGISGTSFKREGFQRLLQDVRERKINCIMVKDLSRLGRNYLETGNLIEKIFPFLECRFIAVTDQFDSMAVNVNESKFTMNIKNLINDMYAKDISKRVVMARKMSAQKGSYVGSFAPYGYYVVNMEGIRKLRINEECAQIVRWIYLLYAQGAAFWEIIDYLYSKKVHTINDYKKYGHVYCNENESLQQWNASTIFSILHNTSYLGNLQQCGLKARQHQDEKEEIIVNGTHQAIISSELAEKVQRRWKDNKAGRRKQHKGSNTEDDAKEVIYKSLNGGEI